MSKKNKIVFDLMNREDFFQLAKNINRYKVLKQLPPPLDYAKIGDCFHSDILYDRGYNIIQLVADGYLELIPRIFPFEKEIVAKTKHSVLTVCPECGSHGVNMPLDKVCGNCGYTETRTYYDAETIHYLLINPTQTQTE